ncbi:hypothetical protein AVEN_187998-1 [Araneus ventricosus]|uniref:Vacuole membrane protein 1 n=1 Tax=Araneus ventricosus TaxID=182803 RepID=A0A4Y2J2Z2_ARAVE|nr:hypothetical protein AVEN_187998-1 [Araneus ventricosus]
MIIKPATFARGHDRQKLNGRPQRIAKAGFMHPAKQGLLRRCPCNTNFAKYVRPICLVELNDRLCDVTSGDVSVRSPAGRRSGRLWRAMNDCQARRDTQAVKRLEKFDKQKMSEGTDMNLKSRKSYENLATNGGIENAFSMQYDTSSLSTQTKQWIASREDRKNLVLWKRPFTTLQYFVKELFLDFYEYGTQLLKHQKLVLTSLLVIAITVIFYHFEGPHQKYVVRVEKEILRCAYWIGLGVLSSVGLGKLKLFSFMSVLKENMFPFSMRSYFVYTVESPYNEIAWFQLKNSL